VVAPVFIHLIMPRDFEEVQYHLEDTIWKLKRAEDPQARRELLQKLRILLREADRAITPFGDQIVNATTRTV